MQAKLIDDACGFCHSDALGKQVCAEYQGHSKMHLHHLPLLFSKVLPLMPTVISGLRMKKQCCFPLIQKNCHNLHNTGHH